MNSRRLPAWILALVAALPACGCAAMARMVLRPELDPIPPVRLDRFGESVLVTVPAEARGRGGTEQKQVILAGAQLLSLGLAVGSGASLAASNPLLGFLGFSVFMADALFPGRELGPARASLTLRGTRFEVVPGTIETSRTSRQLLFDPDAGALDVPLSLVTYDPEGRSVIDQPVWLSAADWPRKARDDGASLGEPRVETVAARREPGARRLVLRAEVRNAGPGKLEDVRVSWVAGDRAISVPRSAAYLASWPDGETRTFTAEIRVAEPYLGPGRLPLFMVLEPGDGRSRFLQPAVWWAEGPVP